MEALTEANIRLLKRVDQIEARLAQLERSSALPRAELPLTIEAEPPLPPPTLPAAAEPEIQTPFPEPAISDAAPAFTQRMRNRLPEPAAPKNSELAWG